MQYNDSIVALATPSGAGAIAIIRISGEDAITIGNSVFQSIKGKDLTKQKSHTLHLGHVIDNQKTLDQVLVSIFKGPHSYTGENTIEISCHGSTYIQQQIIQLLLRKGCRMANPGEFTLRAFLNGKLDLSQAEAVADFEQTFITAAVAEDVPEALMTQVFHVQRGTIQAHTGDLA